MRWPHPLESNGTRPEAPGAGRGQGWTTFATTLPPCNGVFHDPQGLLHCLPRMNNDREVPALSKPDLLAEDGLLPIGRGKIVVKIESDLSNADDLGMLAEFLNFEKRLFVGFARFVRVKSDTGVDAGMPVCEFHRFATVLEIRPGIDYVFYSRLLRSPDGLVPVGRKIVSGDMCVRINKHENRCQVIGVG